MIGCASDSICSKVGITLVVGRIRIQYVFIGMTHELCHTGEGNYRDSSTGDLALGIISKLFSFYSV